MRILDRIRAAWKAQEINDSAALWKFLYGGSGRSSNSGAVVSLTNASRVAAVFACARVISESLATLPWKMYERLPDGGSQIAATHPVQQVLDQPNEWQTDIEFREMLTAHAVLRGNGYAFINEVTDPRSGIPYPAELIPLHPDRVRPRVLSGYQIVYDVYPDAYVQGMQPTVTGLPRAQMLHLRGPTFNGWTGLNIVGDVGSEAVGLGITLQDQNSSMFRNGTRLSGVLEHPGQLGTDVVNRIRDQWQEVFGGTANAGKTAVLEEGTTYKAISMTSEQAQFLESRKFNRSEIASLFRVPAHMINDLERATFSNIEHMSIQFVQDCMLPWARRWESVVKRDLIIGTSKYFLKCNLAGLARGDLKSRYDAYAIGRTWGWLSANDIRALEDLNPIPNGDIYLQPLNMVPAGTEPVVPPTPGVKP